MGEPLLSRVEPVRAVDTQGKTWKEAQPRTTAQSDARLDPGGCRRKTQPREGGHLGACCHSLWPGLRSRPWVSVGVSSWLSSEFCLEGWSQEYIQLTPQQQESLA